MRGGDALEREFPLSYAERRRLAAFTLCASREEWTAFAMAVSYSVAEAYQLGDVDFKQAIEIVRNCSLGCDTRQRILLAGMMNERLRRLTPAARTLRRPQYPPWLRTLAADLLAEVKTQNPELPLTGAAAAQTIDWLIALKLTPASGSLSPEVLCRWYRARAKQRQRLYGGRRQPHPGVLPKSP